MARVCMVTTTGITATRREDRSWKVDGFAADRHKAVLILWDEVFQSTNTTFHLTMSPDECLQRLETNQSDFSNALIELHKTPPEFHQTQPMFAERVQFVSGFSMKDGESLAKDDATVFSNSDLLKPAVYLCASALFILLMGFVFARILMLSYMRQEAFLRLRKKKITPAFMIRREIGRVCYNSTENFKLIALLVSVLMFYMTTSFLCLYKTSQVVIEKPFYPKTYEESFNHKTSLAFFYDQFLAVSGRFSDAPPGSMQRKLWHKLVASGRENDFNPAANSPSQILSLFENGGPEITQNKSIFIGASLLIPVVNTLACASSPVDQIH